MTTGKKKTVFNFFQKFFHLDYRDIYIYIYIYIYDKKIMSMQYILRKANDSSGKEKKRHNTDFVGKKEENQITKQQILKKCSIHLLSWFRELNQ